MRRAYTRPMRKLALFFLPLALCACNATPGDAGGDDASVPLDLGARPDLITYPACEGPSPMGQPFDTGAGGIDSRSLAGDFTVPTLDGDWSLKASWTGCDSYVFVNYNAGITQSKQMWKSDVSFLLAASPTNVHYFFLSNAGDDAAAAADVTAMKVRVDAAVATMSGEDQAAWAARFHYVTKGARNLNNWISQMIAKRTTAMAATLAFGIDRLQKIREVGLLSPVTGAAGTPWEMDFLAYEVRYYNFEWKREQALRAEKAPKIIHVLDGTQTDQIVDVAFPDAATMAGYDTMELDMGMWCKDHLENNCAEWDYIQDLVLCDKDSGPAPDGGGLPCNNPVIIGRFITTYHREGRWVVDVSPLLAYLKDGGTRRLHYNSQYLNQLDIRLSNAQKGGHPDTATPLWNGEWGFGKDYNKNFMPIQVPIPANATRVQLMAFISGHGFGQDRANCAEFCDHEHHFKVNGTDYLKDFPEASTEDGCINHIEDGTIPNQYGTWPFGRGGWCPGLEVHPFVADVTDKVTPGQVATIDYSATFMGAPYVPVPANNGGFGALIRLQSWLVVWTK